jgi:hypothetical protein
MAEKDTRWQAVNEDGFEYAIKRGPHGDEFVKTADGSCLRRPRGISLEAAQGTGLVKSTGDGSPFSEF